jgi:hypothetical protein
MAGGNLSLGNELFPIKYRELCTFNAADRGTLHFRAHSGCLYLVDSYQFTVAQPVEPKQQETASQKPKPAVHKRHG